MSPRWFYFLLILEALVLIGMRWPRVMSLADFAHGDTGAVLTLSQLTASGLRPGIDFTYLYGLGTVAFGDVLFGLFGLSPTVFVCGCIGLAVLYALTLGWAAVGMGARGPGLALVGVGLALGLPIPLANFVHLLEPIFLSLAAGLYARNRPGAALAIVTTCVFVKPALAYVCGLLLVLDGVRAAITSTSGARIVQRDRFLPALGVGVMSGVVLASWYGSAATLATILPGAGLSVFRAEGFGFFFGKGRLFWDPPGANWNYYVGSPTGPWWLMTIFLTGATLMIGLRWLRGYRPTPRELALIFCGVTHAVFVLFVFGPPTAWIYDFNLLLIGTATAVTGLHGRWRLGWILVVSGMLGFYAQVSGNVRDWREWVPVPGTPSLRASQSLAADWVRLSNTARTERVFVFNYLGGVSVLDRHMHAPASWSLYWWNAPEFEIGRTIQELRQADVVAIPHYLNMDCSPTHPANGPVFSEELRAFPFVEEWPEYRLLRRSPSRKDGSREVLP